MGLLDGQFVPALDGVAYGLLLFVVAAGLSLAFGTAGVLNLAHGTLYAAGAYTGAELSDGTWGGLLLGLLVGTAVACAAGVLLSVATAPLAHRGHLAQALLTFGLSLIGGTLLIEFFGADQVPVRVPEALDSSVTLLGHRYPAYRLCFIVMAVALAAIGTWVLTRTRAGAAIRASADDSEMLAATGVNPRLVHTGVLAAAGALAGAAGVLGAPIIGPGPGTAETVLMLSLVVVVLGGLRNLWAIAGAAIVVGQVQTLGVSLVPGWAPYLLFGAMAVVLVVRSRRATATGTAGSQVGARTGAADPIGWLREQLRLFVAPFAAPLAQLGRRVGSNTAAVPGAVRRGLPPAVLVVALAALPWIVDAYALSLVGYALALGLLAVSVTVVTGYAGLPTLGQTAPFAVGAYTTAVIADAGWTVGPVQIVVAAFAAGLFCLVTGPAVIRARGTTVLMITLAVGELTVVAIDQLKSITGGTDGLVGFPGPQLLPGSAELIEEMEVYHYALVVAVIAVAVTMLMLRSPAGRLLIGVHGAEERMRASGHPVDRYLLLAYVGAGALAGVGGSLMAHVRQYISPADVGFEIAAFALLAAVIGGTVSVLGALFGAALIVLTRDWVAASWPGYGPLLLGVLFVLTVYLLPRGLAGLRGTPRERAGGGTGGDADGVAGNGTGPGGGTDDGDGTDDGAGGADGLNSKAEAVR
ncbi:ABC transporter permease [Streptomyces sp. P38-E01]|uniref:ABC transporter permease n=1 Tax=Streptomyces tardus TaxID=2780544 RepID=A0A949JED2_9ACTN|nr:ABC transporter permease [Streptomyces tardus]MBU7597433.1 ABC transporter permease [Streptomyces tardus]